MNLQMKKSKQLKPAKHTRQSFYDQQAINVVSAWLAETQRAMPDLKANDKWPNIDGYIEITDENGFPKGTLKAQVKKLSKANANKKQHSFKDYKFLSYCRESLDWIPILFIGVDLDKDLDKQQAYWLHIDKSFVEELKGNKTVKFIDSQIIKSKMQDFIRDWEKIIQLYDSKAEEFEKYKKAFSIISDIITPALGRTDNKFVKIHYFLDDLNSLLDGKFTIIKRIFYPSAWKIGLAYYQYKNNELAYTLYPVPSNKNDVQIKKVDKSLHDRIQKEGLGFVKHFAENPIENRPNEYAKEIIKSKASKLIENKLLNHSGSDFLAREFVFAFIDEFQTQMGLQKKDKYTIEEIENAFYKYLPLWLEEAHKFLISENRNNFNDRIKQCRILYSDPNIIFEIGEDERETITGKVKSRIINKENISNLPMGKMGNKQFPFGLFVEFFSFLKQKTKEITRLYRPKDLLRCKEKGCLVWEMFSKKDAKHNFNIFFESLPRVCRTLIRNNFPLLEKELSLFEKADKIAVSWLAKDNYNKTKNIPIYEMFYLKSEKRDIKQSVEILNDEETKMFKNIDLRKNNVNFRGENYKIIMRQSSILDFLYEDTPMLNFIYKLLEDKLKAYFNAEF